MINIIIYRRAILCKNVWNVVQQRKKKLSVVCRKEMCIVHAWWARVASDAIKQKHTSSVTDMIGGRCAMRNAPEIVRYVHRRANRTIASDDATFIIFRVVCTFQNDRTTYSHWVNPPIRASTSDQSASRLVGDHAITATQVSLSNSIEMRANLHCAATTTNIGQARWALADKAHFGFLVGVWRAHEKLCMLWHAITRATTGPDTPEFLHVHHKNCVRMTATVRKKTFARPCEMSIEQI